MSAPARAPLLVVKTGTTLPELRASRGDYEQWIAAGLGEPVEVASVYEGDALPDPRTLGAAIVTGSSAMVSDRAPWSERTARWLAGAVDAGLPLLGICYGHQLLARALGGEVGPNPRGREIGTVAVDFDAAGDPLLGGLGRGERFQATHVESVLRLPRAARRLGSNAADPHHAFRIAPRAWGVQFHPEFDAGVMRAYLQARRPLLLDEGIDVDARLAAVRETPQGPALLRRFAGIVRGGAAGRAA